MTVKTEYGPVAKALHWLVVALMAVQFPLGWLMPEIKRNMTPGAPMNLHISLGIAALALIALRILWRLVRPIAADPDLPAWQNRAAALMHVALYALTAAVTLSGWFYASMRGWTVTLFGLVELPALAAQGSSLGRALGRPHEEVSMLLLIAIAVHVAAALFHHLVLRDRVLTRMLPQQ